jgi:hypothetical protein
LTHAAASPERLRDCVCCCRGCLGGGATGA